MHLTISRAALARELAVVEKACAKQTTIPILANVRLDANDGLKLTGTDLELAIAGTVECEVKEPGSITLPKQRLLDLMRVLGGDVTIKTTENNWATVTAGQSKVRIAGMSVESFPELPAVPEGFPLPLERFTHILGLVLPCISDVEVKFSMSGALVEFGGGFVRCVATDGNRLAVAESPVEAQTGKFLMPKRAVGALKSLSENADGAVTAAHDDNHLFFSVGGRTLTARKVAGNFMDYNRALPKDMPHTVTIAREPLRTALQGAYAFAPASHKDKARSVRVTFRPGEAVVFGSSLDAGEYEQPVPCDYNGAEMAFGFNAQFLLDFLGAVGSENVTVLVDNPNKAVELRADSDPGYRYVAMPMRI